MKHFIRSASAVAQSRNDGDCRRNAGRFDGRGECSAGPSIPDLSLLWFGREPAAPPAPFTLGSRPFRSFWDARPGGFGGESSCAQKGPAMYLIDRQIVDYEVRQGC